MDKHNGKKTILVIEDDPASFFAVEINLIMSGYKVYGRVMIV